MQKNDLILYDGIVNIVDVQLIRLLSVTTAYMFNSNTKYAKNCNGYNIDSSPNISVKIATAILV